MPYQDFYQLDAWKQARLFKLQVYRLLKRLPAHEQYDLISQLRRAVRSIPVISEGHGRRTIKDELIFCTFARGSFSEVLNHLIDAMDSGYISKEELLEYKVAWGASRKFLNGYMKFLRDKLSSGTHSNAGRISEDSFEYNESHETENEHDFLSHISIAKENNLVASASTLQPFNPSTK